MIAWKYLNKQDATIRALKDYENMTCILNLTPEGIKNLEEEMATPCSSHLSDMPRVKNIHKREEMLVKHIEQINVLRQRYHHAVEYMDWFKPAWDSLSREEQIILSEFYLVNKARPDCVEIAGNKLSCSRSDAYRRKDKALEHLSTLLYGY